MINSLIAVAAATGMLGGCETAKTVDTSGMSKVAESRPPSIPSTPSVDPQADRQVLAAAGYFTRNEAKQAGTVRMKAGVSFRDGRELVGTTPPAWQLSDWVGRAAASLEDFRGKVVIVRFWTSPDCPFCSKTLPALQGLADEFADQPLAIIGAYHAKPALSVADMKAPSEIAAQWNVRFPIAFDREWKTLRLWWLGAAPRDQRDFRDWQGRKDRVRSPGACFSPVKRSGGSEAEPRLSCRSRRRDQRARQVGAAYYRRS